MSNEELSATAQEIDAFIETLSSPAQERIWYAQHGMYRYDERLVPVDMDVERRQPLELDELPPEDEGCDPSLD
jgi:hypothetical protein